MSFPMSLFALAHAHASLTLATLDAFDRGVPLVTSHAADIAAYRVRFHGIPSVIEPIRGFLPEVSRG
jgi:hypothetical protein